MKNLEQCKKEPFKQSQLPLTEKQFWTRSAEIPAEQMQPTQPKRTNRRKAVIFWFRLALSLLLNS